MQVPGDTASAEILYTVTRLAAELGVTPRTLRFYEDKGLIAPRRAGNARIYTRRDRARMILILRGKRLGLSLRDIREFLDLYAIDRTQGAQMRQLLKAVRARIETLEEQRVALAQTLRELRDLEVEANEILAGRKPDKRRGEITPSAPAAKAGSSMTRRRERGKEVA